LLFPADVLRSQSCPLYLGEPARCRHSRYKFGIIQAGGVGTIAIQLAKHLGATVATTTSAKNAALVKSLGADVVVDYDVQDFEKILSGYDLVLNSQDPKTLEKSLRVLKPGGQLISISGPPDPAFAQAFGVNPFLKLVMRLLSRGVRKRAKALGVRYSFLFMRAHGAAVESDYVSDRIWRHPAGCRQGIPV
jgi:NADPH:quinone reductase-like Zn-dependent oxidoreductase